MSLRRCYGVEAAAFVAFYSSISGFDGSSNMCVEKMLDENSIGTMSHAFVLSFEYDPALESLRLSKEFLKILNCETNEQAIAKIIETRSLLGAEKASLPELKSFLTFASVFPQQFFALSDTYDTIRSGLLNYIVVAYLLD